MSKKTFDDLEALTDLELSAAMTNVGEQLPSVPLPLALGSLLRFAVQAIINVYGVDAAISGLKAAIAALEAKRLPPDPNPETTTH